MQAWWCAALRLRLPCLACVADMGAAEMAGCELQKHAAVALTSNMHSVTSLHHVGCIPVVLLRAALGLTALCTNACPGLCLPTGARVEKHLSTREALNRL